MELTEVLQRDGATVLASRYYGVLLKARQHLVFVRLARFVDSQELTDVLQAAGIGPGRFDRLLSEVRLAGSSVP